MKINYETEFYSLKNDFINLQKEKDRLSAKIENIRFELKTLQFENKNLKNENKKIKNINIKWKITRLKDSHREIQTSKDKISKKFSKLENKTINIMKNDPDFSKVVLDKKELLEVMIKQKEEIKHLKKENLKHSEQFKIVSTLHSKENIEELFDLIQKLQKNNKNLMKSKNELNQQLIEMEAQKELDDNLYSKRIEQLESQIIPQSSNQTKVSDKSTQTKSKKTKEFNFEDYKNKHLRQRSDDQVQTEISQELFTKLSKFKVMIAEKQTHIQELAHQIDLFKRLLTRKGIDFSYITFSKESFRENVCFDYQNMVDVRSEKLIKLAQKFQ